MKLILIFFCGLLALVAAADTGAKEQCAKTCDPRDSCCIAKCYQVPCPSESQVDDTHDCVAACPQGTGSPADTQKYADCEQRCFDTHYLPAAGVAATTTSSGATASSTTTSGTTTFSSTTAFTTTSSDTIASGISASGTHTTQTDTTANSDSISSKESGSSSPTSAAHTTNAAVNIQISALSVSIFGLVIAAFAL
ncbi:uncharacterized protein N7484_010230 [Penicillium longicatenatum]|uniref:uncharacterized protein n=1 Tax=Penicillium longicatenatum TaxID=1561947 RepID=UPI002546FA82|nr:uncharacterized protein N7484_010230 [Penicillium longicatenatum]KAJ5636917.1 hypothetical protein N7484_010230 [Penicillium longicatenatum]